MSEGILSRLAAVIAAAAIQRETDQKPTWPELTA